MEFQSNLDACEQHTMDIEDPEIQRISHESWILYVRNHRILTRKCDNDVTHELLCGTYIITVDDFCEAEIGNIHFKYHQSSSDDLNYRIYPMANLPELKISKPPIVTEVSLKGINLDETKQLLQLVKLSKINLSENASAINVKSNGCRKGSRGCKELLLIDTAICRQVFRNRKNMSAAWVDYKKAYDSVPHSWLKRVLEIYKIDDKIFCANISHQRLMLLEKDKKEKWICSGCRNKERKGDNLNTPIQSRTGPRDRGDSSQEISTPNSDYITQRKKSQLPSNQKVSSPTQPGDESLMLTIRSEIKSSMGKFLNQAIEESSIKMDLRTIKEELSSLKDIKSGLEFLSAEYDRMKKELKTSEEHIKSLSAENSNLHTKVNELSNILVLLEQYSRETNIEVNGVPESKTENLINIAKQICNTVSISTDLIESATCTRVRKMNDSNKRPRAIIIKLPSVKTRDEILAAVTQFNKKNASNKLNTGHLGYIENKSPIFVSEHLAPFFKALHARTRQVAREKQYDFVWIRNGRIFVRKNDQSPAKQIKCYDNLNRL
ncbi:unnamed protein product [Parnassius mnemosyne]|uniref:FP protein C-terminal domain-containing protein n=1 Tax=Parnassius mnemosyne TaxID=213953 RepID=A0AAV1L2U8_9NEOP